MSNDSMTIEHLRNLAADPQKRRELIRPHVDPADMARELGVLQPWERAEGF